MSTYLRPAILMTLVMTVLTGLIYPLVVTGLAQALFPRQANGSLILKDGKVVGSSLIGQPFDDPRYFWSRPSAASPFPYNAAASSGSNLGPTNPTLADLVQDIVDILRREVQALIAEGVSYIQLDSLRYVIQLADTRTREQMRQAGQDLDKALDETIAADNATLQDARRAGVTVGLHMCRGNNRSAWRTSGGYEVIAEKAFNLLEVDRFLLEYDTERAGGFEPLRFVPPGKRVVLGLISSKDPQLESQDQLLRRIDEAAKYVPIERLALSPQCGFASTAPGNLLTWDEQRRKLELVAETARKVWSS